MLRPAIGGTRPVPIPGAGPTATDRADALCIGLATAWEAARASASAEARACAFLPGRRDRGDDLRLVGAALGSLDRRVQPDTRAALDPRRGDHAARGTAADRTPGRLGRRAERPHRVEQTVCFTPILVDGHWILRKAGSERAAEGEAPPIRSAHRTFVFGLPSHLRGRAALTRAGQAVLTHAGELRPRAPPARVSEWRSPWRSAAPPRRRARRTARAGHPDRRRILPT